MPQLLPWKLHSVEKSNCCTIPINSCDADKDAYNYMIYVNDYDQGGVAGTGARITLYGETQIEMEVADGDSGELWVVPNICQKLQIFTKSYKYL